MSPAVLRNILDMISLYGTGKSILQSIETRMKACTEYIALSSIKLQCRPLGSTISLEQETCRSYEFLSSTTLVPSNIILVESNID